MRLASRPLSESAAQFFPRRIDFLLHHGGGIPDFGKIDVSIRSYFVCPTLPGCAEMCEVKLSPQWFGNVSCQANAFPLPEVMACTLISVRFEQVGHCPLPPALCVFTFRPMDQRPY